MDFRILGPLEVEQEGRAIPVGRRKHRAVLAVLLLHANRVVSVDRLIDAVWGEQAPETAHTILQGYVSALRKALGAELIVTRAPGYLLRAERESIDLGRFEVLVRSGKNALAAGDATTASQRFAEALSLWRGEPLEDLDSLSVVETERGRLEETRLGALEEWIEAELALGRHAEVIPEVQALVREHPLRERLRGQLMLALYRSGRQAEALDVYRQGRHLLAEELGLEPGEPLRRLERAILEHDPGLGPVAPSEVPRMPSPDTRHAERDRSAASAPRTLLRPRLTAAVAVCAAAGAAVALGVVLAREGHGRVAVVPNSIAVIDTNTNELAHDAPVGRRPIAVAAGEGAVWVCREGGTVARIDPTTRHVTKAIDVGTDCNDVAVGFGSAWVAGGDDGTVVRIDPGVNEPEALDVRAPGAGSSEPVLWIAAGARSVWATRGDRLLRIDPATNRVLQAIAIPPAAGLAAGREKAWVVTAPGEDRLLGLGAEGGEGCTQQSLLKSLPANAVSPTATSTAVWFVVYLGVGEVWRCSGSAKNVSTATGRYPLDVAIGDGAAWVVNVEGTVSRLDPALTTVVKRIPTAPTARSSIAVGYGAAWVAIQDRY